LVDHTQLYIHWGNVNIYVDEYPFYLKSRYFRQPKWPQAPVAKGASNVITAGFNAAAAGPFNKEVYVRVKGVSTPVTITITGEVVPNK
jgi:hypothetical protein